MNKTSIAAIAAALVVIALGAWLYATRVASTDIASIARDPRAMEGKVVTIAGEVTERANLVLLRYFVVRDKSGEIPVVTDRILPAAGSRVRVSGYVREAFSLGDQQLLVLEERTGQGR